MSFNKWKFLDAVCTGAGMSMLYQVFFVQYSMLGYVAGALGCAMIPISIFLGTYESRDTHEKRSTQ